MMGSSWAFLISVLFSIGWALSGSHFRYSDSWELVINTGTSIVTFLMVFLIQNTQNRDAKAVHLKLNELLRAVEGARTGLVNLQALSDEDLAQLQSEFERLQKERLHVDKLTLYNLNPHAFSSWSCGKGVCNAVLAP